MTSHLALAARALAGVANAGIATTYTPNVASADQPHWRGARLLLEEMGRLDEASGASPAEALAALVGVLPAMGQGARRCRWPLPGEPWPTETQGDWREALLARLVWRGCGDLDALWETPELLTLLASGFTGVLQQMVTIEPRLLDKIVGQRVLRSGYSCAEHAMRVGDAEFLHTLLRAGEKSDGLSEKISTPEMVVEFVKRGIPISPGAPANWRRDQGLTRSQMMVVAFNAASCVPPEVALRSACLVGGTRAVGEALKAIPDKAVRFKEGVWSISPALTVLSRTTESGSADAWARLVAKLWALQDPKAEMAPGIPEHEVMTLFLRGAPAYMFEDTAFYESLPKASLLRQARKVKKLPDSPLKNFWVELVSFGHFFCSPRTDPNLTAPQIEAVATVAKISCAAGGGKPLKLPKGMGPAAVYHMDARYAPLLPKAPAVITDDLLWAIGYYQHASKSYGIHIQANFRELATIPLALSGDAEELRQLRGLLNAVTPNPDDRAAFKGWAQKVEEHIIGLSTPAAPQVPRTRM